jgi:hypothetical protein
MDVMTSVSAFSPSAIPTSIALSGAQARPSPNAAAKTDSSHKISDEDQRVISKLRARDREVRAHEQAHQAAGGQHAGSASYSYQSGPDGRQYAVGGEVPIDAGAVAGDPRATIEKMRQVKAAALAPAKPSGQDRKVAAMADATAAKAQAELNAQRGQESDPATPQGRLDGSLAQHLAELRQNDEPSGIGSSASTAPDLSAYATNAYRHQASSITN